ncbi:DNA-directed RNA polymerase subunit beta', partial [Candidatus Dojkabacteria bacterium]|nr:DNA-directed RNA polymerase subunit beta' [Candidatus Dojkabacteria bacterium]
LPRVEELFEARTPKGEAIVSDIDGKVEFITNEEGDTVKVKVSAMKDEKKTFKLNKTDKPAFKSSKKMKKNDVLYTTKDGKEVLAEEAGQATFKDGVITLSIKDLEENEYEIGVDDELIVEDGVDVIAGTQLTKGSLDPKDILILKDVVEAAKYVIDEVQKVYGSQGISINDKHVELIVRQMTKYVRVMDPGDSEYLHGELISNIAFEAQNEQLKSEGKRPIKASRKLVGITTSAIKTESFLSAASFQEQVRVLTDAALIGKVDYLRGLKENVIIGKLVPLGDAVNGPEEEEEFQPVVTDDKFSMEVEREAVL